MILIKLVDTFDIFLFETDRSIWSDWLGQGVRSSKFLKLDVF